MRIQIIKYFTCAIACILSLNFCSIKTENISHKEPTRDSLVVSKNCDIKFPSSNNPLKESLICFFNENSCPTCVFEVKEYCDILKRSNSFNLEFYTHKNNKSINNYLKKIPNLNIIEVDPYYLKLSNPIILKIDKNGSIVTSFNVLFESPHKTREFISNLIINNNILSGGE